MKNKNSIKKNNGWVKLAALKYPVYGSDGEVILEKGTTNVLCQFRSGCFKNVYTGERVNKYWHDGEYIYGYSRK